MSGARARLGVVGLGRMGAVHVANLAGACPSAELVACTDADTALAAAVGERYGVKVAPDLEALLADDGLDGVVIATPTPTHADAALAAAAAGVPTFCEKPISLERAATLAVVEAFESAGVLLQVGFNRRFDATVADTARRVRDGELGAPYLLRISQRDQSPPPMNFLASSGGIFLDMGIHDFDLARFLVGDIVRVHALGTALSDPGFAALGDADTALVTLEFANGALGVVDLSRVAGYGYESSAELMGEKATVRLEMPPAFLAEWRRNNEAARPLLSSYDRRYGPAFVAELEAFAQAVRAGTPSPVSGREALAAFDVALAATAAHALGHAVAPQDAAAALATHDSESSRSPEGGQ